MCTIRVSGDIGVNKIEQTHLCLHKTFKLSSGNEYHEEK